MTTTYYRSAPRSTSAGWKLARLVKQQRALASKLEQIDGKIAKLSPPAPKKMSAKLLDRLLDQLTDGQRPAQSLPADFSRADIYTDHD